MPTRFHKCRKKRGDRKMGYGRIGNHHKHPGGRGMSGSKHHHKTWVNRWHPGYFGKRGMRQFHRLNNRNWCPTINVSELWRLVPQNTQNIVLKDKKKTLAPIIDVVDYVSKAHKLCNLIFTFTTIKITKNKKNLKTVQIPKLRNQDFFFNWMKIF